MKITDKEILDFMDEHATGAKMDLGGGWGIEFPNGRVLRIVHGSGNFRDSVCEAIRAEKKEQKRV